MITDEEYEAELRARTPEEWSSLQEKALAAGNEMVALQHLMWRRDAKDWEHTVELSKPGMSLADRDFVLRHVCEIGERLQEARDNPEERERRRWFNVLSAASMVASNEKGMEDIWLEQARDSFSKDRGPRPDDNAPLIDHAIYAVECLLDALLMKPADRAELQRKMHTALMGWCDENGIRSVTFPGTPYDQALQKQKQASPKRHGGRFNAHGQGEMFGAEIIPLKPEAAP